MKKFLYFILGLGILYACSTDTLETEQLITADAKPSVEEEELPTLSYDQVCANESVEFCVNFPQAYKGNGETKETLVKFELKIYGDNPETDELEDFYYAELLNSHEHTQGCFSHTFTEAATYEVRYKTKGAWIDDEIVVEDCGCDESFSYTVNGESEYTFFYTPAEDMDDALVVFTFAQSVEVSGLEGWDGNGQPERKIMDLEKCVEYSWTVTLEKNCSGNSPNSNVWTDFKVNGDSKRNENTPILKQSCN